jgi:hypothetical protein
MHGMATKRKKTAGKRRDSPSSREHFWMLIGEIRAQQRFIHQLVVSMPEYVLGPRRVTEQAARDADRLAKLEERVTALEGRLDA